MTTDLILGTAGHIDHGKTSLVKALTGVDTDRLPEEKRRGITIDLGFAELPLGDCRLGIVDVPGHERFVRNMLAGATGIDLALLVVAADDSVKPQTREHLDILALLGIQRGVIALTKCDTADPQWIDLVEQEVRELAQGTFLQSAPIVRTSVLTGQGLDQLRGALQAAALESAALRGAASSHAAFRLPIDRAFTVAGHGTVVTGSVSSGTARLGDELMLEPGGVAVRVRGLRNHNRPVEQVHRGQRAAVNLAGVHHEQIHRGQELATPGYLCASRLLSVDLRLLASAPRPLKHRTRIRCHVGTSELMAGVVLLEHDLLAPGQRGMAQLFLSQPAVTTWGQPFVLRAQSPVITIGGGRVLDPTAPRLRRRKAQTIRQLEALGSPDPLQRAAAAVYFLGLRDWQPADLARATGAADGADLAHRLRASQHVTELRLSTGRRLWVHCGLLDELFARVERWLAREHEANPLRSMLDRSRLVQRLKHVGSENLADALLETMARHGRLDETDRGVALPGRGPQLSRNERALLEQIIATFQNAGLETPPIAELARQAARNQAAVPQLVALAVANGDLVEIARDYYLHSAVAADVRRRLSAVMAGAGGLTLSQIREHLGTSRKYAVPLCEYLDRTGFTRRDGDLRYLAQPSPQHSAGGPGAA